MLRAAVRRFRDPHEEPVDLRNVAFEDVVARLRVLGEGLLMATLRGERQPDASALLTIQHMERLGRAVRAAGVPAFEDVLSCTRKRSLKPAQWRNRIWQQVRWRLQPDTIAFLPTGLWRVAGHAAWDTPATRRGVAVRARAILSEQYLFEPGSLPLPIFSDGTFWALLALVQPCQHDDVVIRGLGRLRREAAVLALGGGPHMGFWDQFAVGQARRCWPAEWAAADPRLRQVLNDLAWLREIDARSTVTHDMLTGSDWVRDRPIWLSSQYEPLLNAGENRVRK